MGKKGNIFILGITINQHQFNTIMVFILFEPPFVYAKTKAQISCMVIAQLNSGFVFAT